MELSKLGSLERRSSPAPAATGSAPARCCESSLLGKARQHDLGMAGGGSVLYHSKVGSGPWKRERGEERRHSERVCHCRRGHTCFLRGALVTGVGSCGPICWMPLPALRQSAWIDVPESQWRVAVNVRSRWSSWCLGDEMRGGARGGRLDRVSSIAGKQPYSREFSASSP
ncbi:hypothetical protein K491DRAFT_220325 [Lophiostoma macrostomum CBS 122681]|uniref:Uncharacterized protein n=1 Tax=Lophiostoma macrostomum CBS 122681 TaxID=1314788 RepID=A0A6A6SRL8_9PLEO|nr:hypothetical protein K491DRAFT_220325 [Lophiostoma macrostomum CBS 122681]